MQYAEIWGTVGIPGKNTQGINNVQILPFSDLSGLTVPFGLGWGSL